MKAFSQHVGLIMGSALLASALFLSLYWSAPATQAQPSLPFANVGNWQQSNQNGFGDTGNVSDDALEVFNGQLYAGASNYNKGATT